MDASFADPDSCRLSVAFDLTYVRDGVMTRREVSSLARQLMYCWSANRRAAHPAAMHLTGFAGGIADELQKWGADSWLVHRHELPPWEALVPREVVYLSPDAADELAVVDPSTTYIIGGLVDRTTDKSRSMAKATGASVRAMRLPVARYVPSTRKAVLNIDVVFALLLAFVETGDWASAFEVAMPARHCDTS